MSISFENKIAFLLLLFAVVLYRTELLEYNFGWSNSTSQFVLAPVVLLAVFIVTVCQSKVPRLAIILAAITTISLGIASFDIVPQRHDSVKVYLSPFPSDRHESESIKFSDLLQKMFKHIGVDHQIERISNPLLNTEAVYSFLTKRLTENSNEATLVLAGSPRWLTLSVSPKFSEHFVSSSMQKTLKALRLNLATQVSGVGLSNAFLSASREYIAHIISGFIAINDGNLDKAEYEFLNASSIVGLWSSSAHRAYSLWLLGNVYLDKTFEADSIEVAHLECAIEYLTRARRFIRNRENPELLAAILNNRGTAHFLSYVILGKKEFRKQALREFRSASKLKYKSDPLFKRPAWLVAKENLYYLKEPKDLKKQYNLKIKKKLKKKKS